MRSADMPAATIVMKSFGPRSATAARSRLSCLSAGGVAAASSIANPLAAALGWRHHPADRPPLQQPPPRLLGLSGRYLGPVRPPAAASGSRSGAGVEPTQPWVTRPHRF